MWISFQQSEPEQGDNVAVYCGLEKQVVLVENYDTYDSSNNWTMWYRIPDPTEREIESAQKLHDKRWFPEVAEG